jgi:hypothetical protein
MEVAVSNVRIQLRDKKGADKTRQDVQRGDVVSWQNQTNRGRTITFSLWPFVEAPQPIMVDAKDKSEEFTVADSVTTRAYPYVIEPSINPDDGPPDEPSIDVGD